MPAPQSDGWLVSSLDAEGLDASRLTGMHIDRFGDQYLLGPLGIEQRTWECQPDGLPLATGGLWLRARDSAKIGQLFLDGGAWNGQQLAGRC